MTGSRTGSPLVGEVAKRAELSYPLALQLPVQLVDRALER